MFHKSNTESKLSTISLKYVLNSYQIDKTDKSDLQRSHQPTLKNSLISYKVLLIKAFFI